MTTGPAARPYLAVFAACCAGMVCLTLGLLGLAVQAYGGPDWQWLAGALITVGVGASLVVFAGVVAAGIAHEWQYIDARNTEDAETRLVTLDERRERLAAAAATVPAIMPVTDDDGNERAWRLALERFFRAGDKAGGFSIRKLEGVVGSDTWARLTNFYTSDDGNHVLRIGPGDQGTVWNWGWEIDYVLQRLGAGGLPRPSGIAPEVQVYVTSATLHDAPRQRKRAAGAVIEHAATGKGS